MSVRRIKAGTTDVSVVIRIVDSADGTPETGVEHNTTGIDLWYRREGAASTDITEAALSALTDAHSDGGLEHINDGYYRLDLPDAACASGVTGVQIGGTVTDMVVLAPYIELVAYDPYDTVRLGLTALPNVASGNAGAIVTAGTGTAQINVSSGNVAGSVASVVGAVGSVTGNVGGNVTGSVGSLATQAKADVNAEVVDVVGTDTLAEMSAGAPPASPTMRQVLNYIYRHWVRNKKTVDASGSPAVETIYADDGTTPLYDRDISDSANVTTFSETAAP